MNKTSKKGRISKKDISEMTTGKKDVALYIVHKWVDEVYIQWSRDMPLAYRLIRKFPEKEFWESLICKFKSNSVAILIGKKSLAMLELKYKLFKKNLNIQKCIVIAPNIEHVLQTNKVGEDKNFTSHPKTVMEFIKKYG